MTKLHINYKKLNDSDVIKLVNRLKGDIFVSPSIASSAINGLNTAYASPLMNGGGTLHIIGGKSLKAPTIPLIIMEVNKRVGIIRELGGNGVIFRRPIFIYLYLLPHKKYYPSDGGILSENNINSGSSNTYTREINIWRTEELFKVLVHELLHIYGFDYNIYNNTRIDEYGSQLFGIRKNINLNEAYIEALATLINSSIIGPNNYKKILDDEITYSIDKGKDVLEYLKKSQYNQDTSAFSYYVLKAALLSNIEKFIEFINTYTNNCVVKYNCSDKYIELLMDSFSKIYSSNSYEKKYLINNSLRMTKYG